MVGVIFALLSAIFVAFSQLSLRKSYQELPPSVAFLFDATLGFFVWVPLALFMGVSGNLNWGQALFYAAVSAILSEAIVFYALSRGELAVTATVLATYPVYTVIFSRIFNNETLSFPIATFVCLAIFGSIIASTPNSLRKTELKLSRETFWPFVAAVCIGLSDTLSKSYINKSGDFSFLFSLGFVQIPIALAYLKIDKQSFGSLVAGIYNKFNNYKFAFLGGLFNIIGTGFLWLSFSYSLASIASPITGANGALTVLLSRIFLKEKIVKRKYIGIILAFIGVIGIAILKVD